MSHDPVLGAPNTRPIYPFFSFEKIYYVFQHHALDILPKRIWFWLVAQGAQHPHFLSRCSFEQMYQSLDEERWQNVYQATLKLFKHGFIEVEHPLREIPISPDNDVLQAYMPLVPDPEHRVRAQEIRNYYRNVEFIVDGEYVRPKRVKRLMEKFIL